MWQRAKIIQAGPKSYHRWLGKILWVKAKPPVSFPEKTYLGFYGELGHTDLAVYETNQTHKGFAVYAVAGRIELLNEFAENVEIIEI